MKVKESLINKCYGIGKGIRSGREITNVSMNLVICQIPPTTPWLPYILVPHKAQVAKDRASR